MKTLFKYQQKIVDNETKPSSALFMEPGTGKTVTSLALFKKSKQPKLLVICIISKLQDWKDDIASETLRDSIILNQGSKKNKEIIEKREVDTYIINFESVWRIEDEILKWADEETYIIVDESHKMKSNSSKVGKFFKKLKKRTKTKCILTGTPQSSGYLDYYNQMYFIDAFNINLSMFKDTFCVYETRRYTGYPFQELVGYKNVGALERSIKKNSVFFKREINNNEIPVDIDVKLPKPKEYNKFVLTRIYKDYAADNSSKMFVGLRTASSGYIGGHKIDNPKIQWLEEYLEGLDYRVVLFYNFNVERDSIRELLDKMKIPYSEYNGEIKDLTNFHKHDNAVVLCQYMSASLGINDLVKSNVCVMYSPSTNYTDYVQSKKRIDRIGQTKKPLFYNLYCEKTVEENILKTIKKGQNFDDKMFEEYLQNV